MTSVTADGSGFGPAAGGNAVVAERVERGFVQARCAGLIRKHSKADF